MTSLPSGAFHSFNSFRISLGHNRLRSIHPLAFTTLDNTLQYLNLDNNRLEAVPWEALGNLSSLRHLYLGNNFLGDESVEYDYGIIKTRSNFRDHYLNAHIL